MKSLFHLIVISLAISTGVSAQEMAFNGKWKLIKQQSSDLDYFQYMTIQFTVKQDEITVVKEFGPKRKAQETLVLKTNGSKHYVPVIDRTFMSNLYMGIKLPPNEKKEVTAAWQKENVLVIHERYPITGSQGRKHIEADNVFELSSDKNLLTYRIRRSSRKAGSDLRYVFKRADANNAYVYQMTDDWDIHSGLSRQACFISLQGIVNEQKPNLYFIYGPNYSFNYTGELFSYLEKQKHFSFTKLNSLEQALQIFKQQIKGYIIWDKNVRTSLIVAYTLAGLEKGIVITEDLIPLAECMGLKQLEDFRGKFAGKTDYEIYTWAQRQYWHRCAKDLIVWLGGEHGSVMLPGVADYGMMKNAFFTDLSARETDTLEYNFTKKLLAEMTPLSQVMGWHSYKKDLEEEWVTLTSSYALTVDGLHNLPNTSFLYQIPPTPSFKYKNNHTVKPGKKYIPENKVYVALVQTDGLGLGAWVKPGRGSIPYAWEVSMKFQFMSPAMLEYYYSQSTPNDFFIGCLSGSGYMYPKAFPKQWLPKEIENAKNLMDSLDLNVFEIMDYSADKTEAGNNELTKEIVEAYYTGMPNAIGFLNGYFASHTFTVRDKRPFVSYDYYLSAEKSEAEAAGDLEELAALNTDRPYFLLVHVREYSDVARVKSICDKLGSEFEVVPLDVFLKLAGENPTFKEQYMETNKY
ncbi:MAG: GxGYxYP domain-containing protein [bacterium]